MSNERSRFISGAMPLGERTEWLKSAKSIISFENGSSIEFNLNESKATFPDGTTSTMTMGSRGEQPDSPALPYAGALRGDVPLSIPERSEE